MSNYKKHTFIITVKEYPEDEEGNWTARVHIQLQDADESILPVAAASILALAAQKDKDGFEKSVEQITEKAMEYAGKIKHRSTE